MRTGASPHLGAVGLLSLAICRPPLSGPASPPSLRWILRPHLGGHATGRRGLTLVGPGGRFAIEFEPLKGAAPSFPVRACFKMSAQPGVLPACPRPRRQSRNGRATGVRSRRPTRHRTAEDRARRHRAARPPLRRNGWACCRPATLPRAESSSGTSESHTIHTWGPRPPAVSVADEPRTRCRIRCAVSSSSLLCARARHLVKPQDIASTAGAPSHLAIDGTHRDRSCRQSSNWPPSPRR